MTQKSTFLPKYVDNKTEQSPESAVGNPLERNAEAKQIIVRENCILIQKYLYQTKTGYPGHENGYV